MRFWLESNGYDAFLRALGRKGFAYRDVVREAKLKHVSGAIAKELGIIEHWIDNYYILRYMRENWDVNTYYEARSKLDGVIYNNRHPDISIVIGKEQSRFKQYLFRGQKSVGFTDEMKENVWQINIDVTHTTNLKFLVDKLRRGYHGEHKLLVIVLTGTSKAGSEIKKKVFAKFAQLYPSEILQYSERVKILNKREF